MIDIARQMVRYGIKGGVATLINVGLMALLVEVLGVGETWAPIISTLILIPTYGYPVMNRFVFKTADGFDLPRLGKYTATIFAGNAVNYGLYVGLLSVGVWYPVAWIIGGVIVFLGTFSVNRHIWLGAPS